ncbi:hypothetical protein FDP41_013686 [Naegleria fowleri]|uniref:Microbial-type PARG catalytic domain-containing protein n=1 Tax=Naegleria fowleri TaxID=5763 RepID=A0A6A5C103_NAEFO|nr:uncharacterized protein FDP41_013686 [Naegleria fowleri]KAF0980472.1 hypothetical protein FDP41_013686 [Naegleria fowleri]
MRNKPSSSSSSSSQEKKNLPKNKKNSYSGVVAAGKRNDLTHSCSSSNPMDKTYSKIQDLENTEKLLIQSPKFDVDAFRRWYKFYLNENNRDALKSMRIYIMKDTQKAMEQGYYFTSSSCNNTSKVVLRNSEKELFEKQLRMNKVYLYEEQDRVVESSMTQPGTGSGANSSSGSSSAVDAALSSTCSMPQPATTTVSSRESLNSTLITVVKEDCISSLIKLHEKGLNPCILNMASRNKGGGGFETGQPSQEETLFRVSNYIHSLLDPNDIYSKYSESITSTHQQRRTLSNHQTHINNNDEHVNTSMGPKDFYPLSDFQVIYSPNVQLFRNGEDKAYEYLECPLDISIIAASAYIRPGTFTDKKTNQLRMTSKFEEGTKQKIRIILHAALDNGHDSIVLSAFGCGAYKCPSGHTAELFHEVIHKEFPNRFKEIVFAILDNDYTVKNSTTVDNNKKQSVEGNNSSSNSSSNFESFKKVFSN